MFEAAASPVGSRLRAFLRARGHSEYRPRDHLIGALAPASDLRRDRDGTGADTHGEADLGVDVASLLAFVFR